MKINFYVCFLINQNHILLINQNHINRHFNLFIETIQFVLFILNFSFDKSTFKLVRLYRMHFYNL